jgi:hypothetical protein
MVEAEDRLHSFVVEGIVPADLKTVPGAETDRMM